MNTGRPEVAASRRVSVEKPSYIDGILSTHFDECSIAAADTARTAESLFNDYDKYVTDAQVIDEFGANQLETTNYVPLAWAEGVDRAAVIHTPRLALAKSAKRPDAQLQLVAFLNSDMMLPIASFERRTSGQCSYVQLGQEMHDDNMVVTPKAPRTEYVEAVRSLLSKSQKLFADHRPMGEVPRLVTELIHREIDTYKATIEAAMPASICRRVERLMTSTDHEAVITKIHDLKILNNNDWHQSDSLRNVIARELTYVGQKGTAEAFNGHEPKFILARSYKVADTVVKQKRRFFRQQIGNKTTDEVFGHTELLALLRGNVAIKLVEFTESGAVQYPPRPGTNPVRLNRLLLQVFYKGTEANRRGLARIKNHYESTRQDKSKVMQMVSATDRDTFEDLRIVGRGSSRSSDVYGYGSGKDIHGEIDAHVKSWPEVLQAISASWRVKDSTKQAANSGDDMPFEQLSDALGITKQIETHLDRGKAPAEQLIRTLGSIMTKDIMTFSGVLLNKKAGKTQTDVDTRVTLQGKDRRIRIAVDGRPQALDGFDYVTLFDETLFLDTKNKLPVDKVKEIAQVIGAICLPAQK